MPRAAEVASDSEPEVVLTGSTTKTYSTKKRRAASVSDSDVHEVEKEVAEEPEETAAEGEDEDEDGAEEYEIEKIIDAKKGQFGGGRMGYFVKWKGYGEEHNSWVDERDAGNAQELIDLYWEEKKKGKPAPRKSEPLKAKTKLAEKPSRKSLTNIESSVEPELLAKKRTRPKKDELPSDKMDTREEEEEEPRAKKKPRKNGVPQQDKQESDEEIIGDMRKHMKVPSWEELIETIDTVEREEDGELYVFFTLKSDKKRVRENSRVCAEKFPQKLIMFYESNLRWKRGDGEAIE